MTVKVYRSKHDIPLREAMLVWTDGEAVGVIEHPDKRELSDSFDMSVGACFTVWRKRTDEQRRLQLMVDAWHIAAFYNVPADAIHQALLSIPEYRDMLADDCLPREYRNEREAG